MSPVIYNQIYLRLWHINTLMDLYGFDFVIWKSDQGQYHNYKSTARYPKVQKLSYFSLQTFSLNKAMSIFIIQLSKRELIYFRVPSPRQIRFTSI